MIKFFASVCLFFLSLTGSGLHAQSVQHDSILFKQAVQHAISLYLASEGDQSRLYNGTLYRDYSATFSVGHPYFEKTDFSKGTISYDGVIYENVPILYNIITEEVIIPYFNQAYRIALINEKIAGFEMLGHHFMRLEGDSAGVLETGFYDQLYAGNTTVLKKTNKFIEETIANNTIKRSIRIKHRRYLRKDGNWHRVTNLRSVLKLLDDQRQGIRQNLQKNKIRYRKKPDAALINIASFYDSVNR